MINKYRYLVSAQKVVRPGNTVEIKEVNNMNKIKITSQETIDMMEAANIAALYRLKGAIPRSARFSSEIALSEYASFNPGAVELPKGAIIHFSDRAFDCADFSGQCFDGYDFRRGSFQYSSFCNTSLQNTYFVQADLSRANFFNADLRKANLRDAKLIYASFDSADLRGADLTDAHMFGARFDNAKIDETTKGLNIPMACPSEGSFIGWKKALVNVSDTTEEALIKLEIPEDAKRSSATTYKCRTNKAKVLEIILIDSGLHSESAFSYHDVSFIYYIGETVEVPEFDENRFNECSTGIHFFASKEAALEYVLI